MKAQADFRELLALFNAHAVECMIVGAHALAYHGAPRFTGDMDIYVRPDPRNAQRIVHALEAFGFAGAGLKAEDFAVSGKVVQLGLPPVRVDIVTSLTGVSWDEAVAGRVAGDYGDVAVYYIGKAEFIRNKRLTGRQKDLADLEALGEE